MAFISGYTVSKWTKRAVYFYAIGSAFFAFSMLFIWLLDYLKDEQLKGIQYMTLLGVLFTVISEIIYIVFNNFDSRWDTSEPLPAGLGGVMQAGLEAGPSQDIEASASQYDQSETTTTSIKVIDDFKTGAVVVRMSDSSLSTTTTSSHHHHLDDADVWTVKAKRALYTSRLFIGAVSMIILGYITWNVDSLRWICFPSSPFQGHAVWHLFSGVGIALAFLYAHH